MRVLEASISYNLVQLGGDVTVNSAPKAVEYLESAFAATPMQETFWVILLDRKNHAIGRVRITIGTATAALAHLRAVFRPAILVNASSIIAAHTHPSGDPAPSAHDMHVTRQLREGRSSSIPSFKHLLHCTFSSLQPIFISECRNSRGHVSS
jgi:DNA repair protein RadC